jgi:CspA family cold shock protein
VWRDDPGSVPAHAGKLSLRDCFKSCASPGGEHAAGIARESPTDHLGPEGGHPHLKHRGSVKWFSEAKGYGFIREDSGEEFFVHHSAIQAEGFRTLAEGQIVEFDPTEGQKGKQAENVVKLDA